MRLGIRVLYIPTMEPNIMGHFGVDFSYGHIY
jgi:hypothetical protein